MQLPETQPQAAIADTALGLDAEFQNHSAQLRRHTALQQSRALAGILAMLATAAVLTSAASAAPATAAAGILIILAMLLATRSLPGDPTPGQRNLAQAQLESAALRDDAETLGRLLRTGLIHQEYALTMNRVIAHRSKHRLAHWCRSALLQRV